MALIGRIRNNLWLVIVLLGLAMAGFIFMEMQGNSGTGGLLGGGQTTIGEIDGESIDIQEFDRLARLRYSNSGADYYAQRNALWNSLVGETIMKNQAEKLGLMVSDEEMEGLLYGPNYSPIIRQDFPNPQFRGAVNTEQLNQIRELEASNTLNPDFMGYWNEEKNRVKQEQIQNKVMNLVSKSIYTPTWMVNLQNEDQNSSAEISYIRIPFDEIENTEVALEDADYQKYINENKAALMNDVATQTLDYIVFDVNPTAQDSADIKNKLAEKIENFRTAGDVQIFVESNQGLFNEAYYLKDELSAVAKDDLFNVGVGEIYGPYIDGEFYKVAKVLDKKVVPDSVSARHILRSVSAQDPIAMQAARDTIEMIKGMLERKEFTFDSLSRRYGMDGSAQKGGDLGTFIAAHPDGTEPRQNTMIKPFNDLVFYKAEPKELTILETVNGVHLVEVTKQYKSGKQAIKVAYLQGSIVPSKKTQKDEYSKALRFANENRTVDAMKASAKGAGYKVETSEAIDENGFSITGLGLGESTRSMIKWANEASVGEVSPSVYRYIDQARYFENKYVVTGLGSRNPAGVPTVNSAKSAIENVVMTRKKGETIAAKVGSTTDFAAITAMFEEVKADTTNVSFNGRNVLSGEPKVLGAVFGLQPGATTKPIVGNNGVYIARLINKSAAPAVTNAGQLRSTISQGYRSQVRALIPALRDGADIEDKRSKFF